MDTVKLNGFDESKSLHRTEPAMRKILTFSASKTLQEKGQNAANVSQKHWEKMSIKV